jgi:hypothetical protein
MMSVPTPPRHGLFVEHLIRFLMPYFTVLTSDFEAAREEILETLVSYGARTRAEMLNVVQILAFGLSALDVLAEAKAPDLSATLRLRFRGCANGLNRSCQQNEKSLAKRLACDPAEASEPAGEPPAEPVNDVPQAQVQQTLQQTRTKIDTTRNRLSGARPATAPHSAPESRTEQNKRAWGGAMMDALAELGMPVQPVSAA